MIEKIVDGRTDLVFDYISAGKDPNDADENGTSLIKWCAYYGDVSGIKFLLSEGATLDDLGTNFDLNGSAFHGHWQLCQFLLEKGADANYTLPENGETALHNCLSKNNAASGHITELLLAHGADPNAKTERDKETGSFMRDVRTKLETPLHRAAAYGDAKTIELLLQAGADKTIKDMNDDSPITWASWHLRPGKILALLAYGEHTIHRLYVERMQSDHGSGGPSGMELNLLGKVHV